MHIRGVSTRKVTNIVEELSGHDLSKSQVSELAKQLDKDLEECRNRLLKNDYAYIMLDAIYQKVREGGRVVSGASFVAVGTTKLGVREAHWFTSSD